MKKVIETKTAPAPIGPYSQAVMLQGILFVSGQIAIDPQTQQHVAGTAKDEAEQVMKNLQAILTEAGLGFGNVVKTTIFLMDMADFAAVNEVYAGYFTSHFPARETIQASGLPKGARVEISVIAG